MIDLHSHILPLVDDGARSLAESLAMLASATQEGVEAIAATPHVRRDFATTAEQMERSVEALRRAAASEQLPIAVLTGAELDLDALEEIDVAELGRFGLAGNPRYVLLEIPYRGWRLGLPLVVERLVADGFCPVLAHPERNNEVQESPELLDPLVGAGALVQLTAASITGEFGNLARRAAFQLLEREIAHLIATDAHRAKSRRSSLQAAATVLGDDELASWLTTAVPRAIVDDTPLPRRPETRSRSRVRLPRWLQSTDHPRRV